MFTRCTIIRIDYRKYPRSVKKSRIPVEEQIEIAQMAKMAESKKVNGEFRWIRSIDRSIDRGRDIR